jgi:GMP synthase (glutamine-hydrolysing)
MIKFDFVLILDFGSQYTQLIARRIRELGVYCEIQPYNTEVKDFIEKNEIYNLKGIILSGGPSSVMEKSAPQISKNNLQYIYEHTIPVLGICYGLQLLSRIFGGEITKGKIHEYGPAEIRLQSSSALFKGVKKISKVWMSHGDSVKKLPDGFKVTSLSQNHIISSIENKNLNTYGLQFHPEVNHTEEGKRILKNFLFGICGIKNLFKSSSFIENKIQEIKSEVGNEKVLLALSGGVDSSVAAVLLHKAIGKNLYCVHIDTGLMRKNESADIIRLMKKNFRLNLTFVDSSEIFLKRLKGVTNPEEKRKIIGKTFIDEFEKVSKKLSIYKIKYLAQGTLYPDVIESVSFKGPSVTIKSHHNVGGLPSKMKMKLIEPFRELFKDEVRNIGRELGVPESFIERHPFPGPGLAIRILSDVSREKIKLLQDVDEIYLSELKKAGLYNKVWQAFAVLLPVKTVGVMGDQRSYDNVIAIRAVTSTDGMTADFYPFEKDFLSQLSNKIINSVKGVNRVVYDISSKPPATIEWE